MDEAALTAQDALSTRDPTRVHAALQRVAYEANELASTPQLEPAAIWRLLIGLRGSLAKL